MQYMLLIHHERDRVNPADQPQMMQEYMVFTQELVKSGKFKAGDRLDPSAEPQLINYLRASRLQVGLILHFGPKASFMRRVLTNDRKIIP